MATHYPSTLSHSLSLSHTNKNSCAISRVFYGRPQRGVKDELVFSLQTASGGDSSIDPTLADLLLLTNKSISHINYSTPPQLHFSSAICPLRDLCCVWLWLTLCSLYLHNSIFQANPDSVLFLKSQRSTAFLFFFVSLCPSSSLPTSPLCPRKRSVPWPVWIIHRALSMTLRGAPSLLWQGWWWNALPGRSVFTVLCSFSGIMIIMMAFA